MSTDKPGAPPRDLDELRARAATLTGRTLDELAAPLGLHLAENANHQKGKVGELLEWWLGATAGSSKLHDFPQLEVELKTIPVDAQLRPQETTFVCKLHLATADELEWESSWVRTKLSHVLWMPIVDDGATPKRIGTPLWWRPTDEQAQILKGDFDELVGMIGAGGIESITARLGRWLHLRPKAADSQQRTLVLGPDGEWLETVPRGFYLRTRFTSALLQDPTATPD